MCYELFHNCKFCNKQYECQLQNYICPTINSDEDKNMCDSCRIKEQEAYQKWYDESLHKGEAIKTPTLDDWETK